VRSAAAATELASRGIETVRGDLEDATALETLVRGCAAVVHAAGAVRGACQADFDRVNVRGTANLLAATRAAAPAARFLLLSSLAAREPALSWYAASKRSAEALLAGDDRLDWVVLRPPAVYGPGDREMLPVFRMMARGIAPVPGSPRSRLSLVHVADLSEAIITCLESPAVRHRTFYPDDGKPGGYDWTELAAAAGAVWGRRVRLLPLPRRLLDLVARANLALAGLTGRAPMLTPAKLRELRHEDWVVDSAPLTGATGWRPGIPLAEGLARLRKTEL